MFMCLQGRSTAVSGWGSGCFCALAYLVEPGMQAELLPQCATEIRRALARGVCFAVALCIGTTAHLPMRPTSRSSPTPVGNTNVFIETDIGGAVETKLDVLSTTALLFLDIMKGGCSARRSARA
jgi:hypothetical protein